MDCLIVSGRSCALSKDVTPARLVAMASKCGGGRERLEFELWLVLDYFSAATKKPVSPILLALLPSEDQMPKAWPSNQLCTRAINEDG